MGKHKFASISLTVRDRAIFVEFSIHRVFQQSTLANFVQVLEQNSCFPLGGDYAWILWITHEHAAAVCRGFLVTPVEARVL